MIMVQKKFHRDLDTKWVDEQFSLKKFRYFVMHTSEKKHKNQVFRLQNKKMRSQVGPVWKFFLSKNCLPTHFVPKSLRKFFWDHYSDSLIIPNCSIVSPLSFTGKCTWSVKNKMKYFRLRLSYRIGTERPETDMRQIWDRPIRERWIFSALDKLVPDGRIDTQIFWLLELMMEATILLSKIDQVDSNNSLADICPWGSCGFI